MRRSKRRRPFSARKLWLLFWALVGLVQGWDYLRDKPARPPQTPHEAGAHFVALENPRLVEDAANDGDSFKIAHDGGEQTLRLYFVDCPEKRDYRLVHGRLLDQASYFGGISLTETLRIAAEAQVYTERLLRERNFTVQTRWERVFDSQRVYALVYFDDGEELSEKLVRSGLCRLHTKGTMLPNGERENDFEARLRVLEREARSGRRGAWGAPKEAMPAGSTR